MEDILDIAIIGAGIAGIGAAVRFTRDCPDKRIALFERRERVGGTWDLFQYPGVRCDSDMYTLGFGFKPWTHEKSIVGAATIRDYIEEAASENAILPLIQFGTRLTHANWDSTARHWTLTLVDEASGATRTVRARMLYMGSGYYDYDEGYRPTLPQEDAFAGRIVHPQHWPKDLDYSGKRVTIIGSGATAVTIVPSMADKAAHVTMLQRTPTWMFARPAKDAVANFLRAVLPEKLAYRITRYKNIKLQDFSFKMARNKPQKVKDALNKKIEQLLGPDYDKAAFTPPYDPWDQRLCLVPDDDLFRAMKRGKASIVTGHIERFEKGGVRLTSGEFIAADVIVTATGLKLAVAGKIAISHNGSPVAFNERFYYKGCMFSNLPNLAVVFGYLNASWTLRADINSDYVCRVLEHMRATGTNIAVPVLTPTDEAAIEEDDVFDFSSGYIQRGKHIMPRNAISYPWRLNQEYVVDRKRMADDPVSDGLLTFRRVGANAMTPDEQLEAAE